MPKKAKTFERLAPSLANAKIDKPQLLFERQTDNFAEGPWKPLLSRKPHADVPLEQSLCIVVDGNQEKQYGYSFLLPMTRIPARALGTSTAECLEKISKQRKTRKRQARAKAAKHRSNRSFRYKHPYEPEILKLKYPDFVYQKQDPIPYQPIDSTRATWVDTFEGVQLMLTELKRAREIAVDLEHHEKRTYHGLLSLMQISTREKDWVVDTLQPWRHKLEILNEVFADPSIVKVRDPPSQAFGLLLTDENRCSTVLSWT